MTGAPMLWPEDPNGPQPCACETCRRSDSEIQPLHQWRHIPAAPEPTDGAS